MFRPQYSSELCQLYWLTLYLCSCAFHQNWWKALVPNFNKNSEDDISKKLNIFFINNWEKTSENYKLYNDEWEKLSILGGYLW